MICEGEQENQLKAHLATGDCRSTFARTGYLGFIRRTEMTQSDGGRCGGYMYLWEGEGFDNGEYMSVGSLE